MPRHLQIARALLRDPCPIDIAALPRNAEGFSCGDCGRTVVDVSRMTFEEAVAFRRRQRGGGERVCGAYTVVREERVLLRQAPGSATMVAVLASVLIAACDGNHAGAPAAEVHAVPVASGRTAVAVAKPLVSAAAAPSAAPVPSAEVHVGSTPSAVPSANAACAKVTGAGSHGKPGRKHPTDALLLGGY